MSMYRFATIVLMTLGTCQAQAAGFLSFAENVGGVTPWETECVGCPYDLTASFSSTMPGDNLKWNRQGVEFSDPSFANLFGTEASLLSLNRPDPPGAGGETTAIIQFAEPLPQGAKMVIFDVDAIDERLTLFSNISLSAPTVMETQTDPQETRFDFPSVPALWNGATRTLSSADSDSVNNNPFEAYVFDAEGMSNVEVTYTTTAGQASIGFVVPEPSTLSFAGLGVCLLIGLRRHFR